VLDISGVKMDLNLFIDVEVLPVGSNFLILKAEIPHAINSADNS